MTPQVSMIPRHVAVLILYKYCKKKTPYDLYDGYKQLLMDRFNSMYTLVYRPVTASSWSSDSMGMYPLKPPV